MPKYPTLLGGGGWLEGVANRSAGSLLFAHAVSPQTVIIHRETNYNLSLQSIKFTCQSMELEEFTEYFTHKLRRMHNCQENGRINGRMIGTRIDAIEDHLYCDDYLPGSYGLQAT